jgi:predicted Zn-dependent protease
MTAAQGYVELRMPEEALRELQSLPVEDARRMDVMQLMLLLLMQLGRWHDGVELCQTMRSEEPDSTTGYIHGAFCLHELGQTREAKELLLTGPGALRQEATFYYNMGCYDAVLGNVDEARASLERSFCMDERFREIARHDPDLAAVHDLP